MPRARLRRPPAEPPPSRDWDEPAHLPVQPLQYRVAAGWRSGCVHASRALRMLQISKFRVDAHAYSAHACIRHKTRRALRPAKVIGLGAFTAPGSWRAKAAAQLPREWLDFDSESGPSLRVLCVRPARRRSRRNTVSTSRGALPAPGPGHDRDSRVFMVRRKSWVPSQKVQVSFLGVTVSGGWVVPSAP
jgi:hypothetical protein